MPYTGHVTIGGSICIEALTLSGGPGQWQPSYCVESIMNVRRPMPWPLAGALGG